MLASKIPIILLPEFTPREIAARMPCAWFERPADPGIAFTTNIGDVAASAGSTVGLLLDRSQDLALGPELVANGTFDGNVNNWGAVDGNSVISWDNGRLLSTTSAGATGAFQSVSTSVGKLYRVSFTIIGGTSAVKFRINNATSSGFLYESSEIAAGNSLTATIHHVATQTTIRPYIRNSSAGTVYADNISVREVLGYHAPQVTAANRPTLQISGNTSFLRHDGTDVLTVTGLPALSGGNFSTTGSIYWVTPSGMQALHGQTISTSLSLPGANSDVYGWIVTPERLNSVYETKLELYFRRLAGLA